MKKNVLLGITILLTLMLISGCSSKKETIKIDNSDALKFKEEYESFNGKNDYLEITISEKNPIKYSSIDEIIDIINNKSGLIYFGNPECNNCRNVITILIEAAKQTGLKEVYYLNIKNINSDTATQEKLNKLKQLLENNLNEPLVLFVKDGKIVGNIDSSSDSFVKLSETEEKELLKIYKNSIHEVLGDLCDTSC